MEQEQATSTEQTPSAEPTLDQVYQEYKVDDVVQQFQAPVSQPVQQQPVQQAQPSVPDPVLDPNGFKSYIARMEATPNLSRVALQEVTNLKQMLARSQEEADIKTAVSKVKEKLGDVDDDFIEIALGQKARKDQKFAALYANRHRNPQAWNAALNAVGNELKGKFSFRADSQLTENVRAAKQSTQSSLTKGDDGSGSPDEKRFSGKSGRDFDREWANYINGAM